MANYTIKCQDGTDRQCYGDLKIEIPIDNLTNEQVNDIITDRECNFTEQEAENSKLVLTENEKDLLKKNKSFSREVDVKDSLICPACGSDYTRDDEGRII